MNSAPYALRGAQDEALRQIDELIYDQRHLLADLDNSFWVTNLRDDLSPRIWHPRPWWLTDEILHLRKKQNELARRMREGISKMVITLVEVPREPGNDQKGT